MNLPAADRHKGEYGGLCGGVDWPATRGVGAAVSDSVDLANGPTRAIYCGSAGNLAVILEEDTAAVTFVGVLAGTMLPIRAKRVMVTGTTITPTTNILALD